MSPQQCQGCEKALETAFQCPLCEAEKSTTNGFFCSQECFAQHWLAHRDEKHPKTVRAKRTAEPEVATTPSRSSGKRQRASTTVPVEETSAPTTSAAPAGIPHWDRVPPLAGKTAPISPALSLRSPRAVVLVPEDGVETSFWPAAAAAAHVVADALRAASETDVLVVVGSAFAAHAFAWAARCAGVPSTLRLVVSSADADDLREPSRHFASQRRVVVVTEAAVQVSGALVKRDSGCASLWLADASRALLVTLPGVEDPLDLQAVGTRAFFFVSADTAARLQAHGEDEEPTHKVSASILENTRGMLLRAPARRVPGEKNTSGARQISERMSNAASTELANGNISGAARALVNVYSTSPGVFEETLLNTLVCDRAAASLAHAHHRIAQMLRYLVDHSGRFQVSKGATLADLAVRAAAGAASLLPRLAEVDPVVSTSSVAASVDALSAPAPKKRQKKEKQQAPQTVATPAPAEVPLALQRDGVVPPPTADEAQRYFNFYSSTPNIQLQATLCYVYEHGSAGTLDTLAYAWGIPFVVAGPAALDKAVAAVEAQRAAAERIRTRYQAKPEFASPLFLVVLMHFLYDMVAVYSLSVEEVERRTLWRLTLAQDADPLPDFLARCGLDQGDAAPVSRRKAKALSSRLVAGRKLSRVEQLRTLRVRAKSKSHWVPLPWLAVPLSGEHDRTVARLHALALEEVLMAMPRERKPMHIGDVGNLIGRWFRFNAKYDGKLGVTLAEFLRQHPEAFTVAGPLVTRRRDGVTEPVRIRFDNNDGSDDDSDDEGGNKKRDRAALAGRKGGKVELPARARKKRALKEFNQSRFNRNYKSIDPSARVPGYVKHAPRKIKGRGKKANKRNVKRSN